MPVLTDFVKAYDVRGLVPEQLSPDVARALGIAFAEVIAIPGRKDRVVIGHDMRPSSPELSAAFADGVTGRGVDVTLIGLCSTDGLYYASGRSMSRARCSPRATTRQVQRDQAVSRRRPTGRPGHRPRRAA